MARRSKTQPRTQTDDRLPEAPLQHVLDVATLSRARETRFDLQPDSGVRKKIAAFLGIEKLDQMRFKGQLAPRRKTEWRLEGRLTASLEQACVVTLGPVPVTIDETIVRELLPLPADSELDEIDVELDEDDGPDYFEDQIDVGAIALEQVALALDPYPRVDDAALDAVQFAAPGVAPLTDADLKPFAKLADLKEKLSRSDP